MFNIGKGDFTLAYDYKNIALWTILLALLTWQVREKKQEKKNRVLQGLLMNRYLWCTPACTKSYFLECCRKQVAKGHASNFKSLSSQLFVHKFPISFSLGHIPDAYSDWLFSTHLLPLLYGSSTSLHLCLLLFGVYPCCFHDAVKTPEKNIRPLTPQ